MNTEVSKTDFFESIIIGISIFISKSINVDGEYFSNWQKYRYKYKQIINPKFHPIE
jgi:hypothetical protein